MVLYPGAGRQPLPSRPHDRPAPFTTNSAGPSASGSGSSMLDKAKSPSHGRSLSNPLPKLFRRRNSTGWPKGDSFWEVEDEAHALPAPSQGESRSPVRKSMSTKPEKGEAYKSASCMCCGLSVRFPRDLQTFRCSTCLTINDLVPHNPRSAGEARSDISSNTPDIGRPRPRPQPPSVERTRAIRNTCIEAYIHHKLESQHRPALPSYFDVRILNIPNRSRDRKPEGNSGPQSIVESTEPQDGRRTFLEQSMSASIRTVSDFDWSKYADETPSASPTIEVSTSARDKHVQSTSMSGSNRIAASAPNPNHGIDATYTERLNLQRRQSPSQTGPNPALNPEQIVSASEVDIKSLFRPLTDYIHQSYGHFECLNAAFSTFRPRATGRTNSESAIRLLAVEQAEESRPSVEASLPQIDAKMLLAGDIAENGGWWTGRIERRPSHSQDRRNKSDSQDGVNSRSPCIDWHRMDTCFKIMQPSEHEWRHKRHVSGVENSDKLNLMNMDPNTEREVDQALETARENTEKAMFKAMESLLRRPGRPLTAPTDLRFLLVILSTPQLYPKEVQMRHTHTVTALDRPIHPFQGGLEGKSKPGSPNHPGIIKRSLGLLANSSSMCHRYLVAWLSRMPQDRFLDFTDLVLSFVTYRLTRRKAKPKVANPVDKNGLIPDLSGSALSTSTQLQRAAGLGGGVKDGKRKDDLSVDYLDDWQLNVAAKVLALIFAANTNWQGGRAADGERSGGRNTDLRPMSKVPGQLLPISDFYISLLDHQNLISDFKGWEAKKQPFSACQFPFLLSLAAKIKILEYDTKRQMETKARETYFNNVFAGQAQDVSFNLNVRRDCIVEDSLTRISQAMGQMSDDLKKGLRVHFTGEEGIDAGGLRKEWFLLVVRDIFDPNHGLFLYDDESHLCYFNPNSFETSDQYYMVGILLGLAIYNSTILDIALPSFAFRKLIASAPVQSTPSTFSSMSRQGYSFTLADLAELHPRLATGLQALLDFDGDVESTYMWSFVAPIDRYGTTVTHALIHDGENKPVTNANRHEFVNLYVQYLLDTSVSRQSEPFKRGFYTVCAGNAFSLFRAEEIELLIRGSDDKAAVDVDVLRGVAEYENFRNPDDPAEVLKNPADIEACVPRVRWFWEMFSEAEPQQQRKLLQFVTGSDRVPATGAAGLVLRIVAGGDGTGRCKDEEERFPVARTCFNSITLWGWTSKAKLVEKVQGAIWGSEGFGLK